MSKSTKTKKEYLESVFQRYIDQETTEVDFLVKIVRAYRPIDVKVVYPINLTDLLELLNENPEYRIFLKDYINKIFSKKDFDSIITDSAIINDSNFFREVRNRLSEKILPYQPSKDTLQYVLNQVFYLSTDPIWLKRIPEGQLSDILKILSVSSLYDSVNSDFVLSEVIYAIEVLVQRISGAALEREINKMVPELQNYDSPFIALQKEYSDLSSKLMASDQKYITSQDLNYRQVLVLLRQCETYVKTAFDNSHKYGISIKVNQSLLRIRQQLERVGQMLPVLVVDYEIQKEGNSINLMGYLIEYNCQKSNVRKLIDESTQRLSYEVTHHTAQTGEHYITNNRKEYFQMLRTASGGGLVVGFMCIIKLFLGKIDTSIFGHAFYYSMNYALGFILIYLLGYTLATKQPAMTASTLIRALEQGSKDKTQSKDDKYGGFAVFFARVFRSQFIAFVGNVLVAFPVTLFLVWIIDLVFDKNITASKWQSIMTDLSPVHSAAVFHAAIAGCFLFVSGVIAGSIANRDKHNLVYYRIQEHPILKKMIGKANALKLSKLYEKKWAGIVSNFWFGVFMGSVGAVGIFMGLDLDIRHITFSSGSLALGLYGGDFNLPLSMILWGIFGIGVIGMVNFLVSFSLSLSLAFRARNISMLELRLVAISVWKFFKKKPSHFFYPPKNQ